VQWIRQLGILQWLLSILFAWVGFLILVALCIVIWPQIILREEVIRWALNHFGPEDIQIDWKSLKIDVHSQSLLKKLVKLESQQLCLIIQDRSTKTNNRNKNIKDKNMNGCLSQLGVFVEADFSRLKPQINLFKMNSEGNFSISEDSNIQFDASLNWDKKNKPALGPMYSLSADWHLGKGHIVVESSGVARLIGLRGRVSGRVLDLVEAVPQVSFGRCSLDVGREKSELYAQFPGYLHLDCPLDAQIQYLDDLKKLSKSAISLPNEVAAHANIQVRSSDFPPQSESQLLGQVGLKLSPTDPDAVVQLLGQVEVQVNGKIGVPVLSWDFKTHAHLNIKIPHFEDLTQQLKRSPWAIPAPFHVLHGNAQIQIDGDLTEEAGEFPIRLQTHLSSSAQKLNLDGTGIFALPHLQDGFTPRLDFDLNLKDVRLELPRLDLLSALPRFFPDSRVQKLKLGRAAEGDKKKSPFEYHITVKTPDDKPVQILSNLAQTPVPVALALELEDSAPIGGQIQIREFPVEFFRREATIDHLTLDLANPMNLSPVDGVLLVDYTDYKLTVRVTSVIGKPQFILTSEPPLPENQLVAALLFGQPLEELDADQSDSVGNARAAIADGAVNLLSFYVLASTPIQSLGYDPSTGVVSAKIRLGEGTSLNLGTNTGDTATIGLRRRLSRFWTIETDVSRTTSTGQQVATAYLEWSHRY
jgi:hypothetical protein